MSTNFTPGQWHVGSMASNRAAIVYAGHDYAICNCEVYHSKITIDESNANARLIAAAPELYKMLDLIVKNVELSNNLRIEAELALKKARGEAQGME